MGDFNARLKYPVTTEEEQIMGKYTLHEDGTMVTDMPNDTRDNRDYLIEYCTTHELRVLNTMYRKTPNKLATYRKKKEKPKPNETESFAATTHEQLDYIITNKRWRNSISNTESDTKANIDTDHFPVIATVKLKLRKQTTHGKTRDRFKLCTVEQNTSINQKLAEIIEMQEPSPSSLKRWLQQGTEELPKEEKETDTENTRCQTNPRKSLRTEERPGNVETSKNLKN